MIAGKGGKPGLNGLRRGNLKSVVAHGQWPQARLFDAGMTNTNACQLCGATGTMRHQLFECPALHHSRHQFGDDALRVCALEWPSLHLWTRCLLSDPSWQYPPPLLDEQIIWEKSPPSGVLEGDCCSDGSGLRPLFARIRRCGWGLVCHTHGIGFTALAHGPLPGLQQDVPLAESFAFYVALRYAGISVVFFTDCKFVKDTFDAGATHSSSGWFIYASVWREIWRLVDDIGLANIVVRWIPAHTSAAAVAEGRITGLQQVCNAEADSRAKAGAALHPHDPIVASQTVQAHKVAKRVAH